MSIKMSESLKSKGNKSFIDGDFKKAIEHYEEAIRIERSTSNDCTFMSIVLSNMAQSYLKLEDYENAQKKADESVQLDSTNKKSILRRGVSYLNLDQHKKAADDFRQILKSEPKNQNAIEYFRKACPPAKSKDLLLRAYFGYKLRWFMNVRADSDDLSTTVFWVCFGDLISKLAFISQSSSENMSHFLTGLQVLGDLRCHGNYAHVFMPFAKTINRLKIESLETKPMMLFRIPQFKALLAATSPDLVTLHCMHGEMIPELKDAYDYSQVFYIRETLNFQRDASKANIQDLKKHADILTDLPYFHKFTKYLKNTKFPNLKSIQCNGPDQMEIDFLEHWHESDWNIERLVYYPFPPSLQNFYLLKEPVSNTVVDLYMPLTEHSSNFDKQAIRNASKNVDKLRKAFPSLQTFTGTYEMFAMYDKFVSAESEGLQAFMTMMMSLVDDYFHCWCILPLIQITFVLGVPSSNSGHIDHSRFVANLKKIADNLREEYPAMMCVDNPRPIVQDFGYMTGDFCFSMISATTEVNEFQFYFKTKEIGL